MGLAVDSSGRLWVYAGNNRKIYRYDSAATKPSGTDNYNAWLGDGNAETDANSLGQTAGGVAVDTAGRLWVADPQNNRVLRFDNAASKPNSANADGVLGQTDFTSGSGCNYCAYANTLASPSSLVADAAGRLWVADTYAHRVLRFDNAASKANGANADGVLGQADFTGRYPANPVSASGLYQPRGLAVDGGGRLYVADSGNRRILIFAGAASQANGANAQVELGQIDFANNLQRPVSAQALGDPYGLTLDPVSGALWVTDKNRVLWYSQSRAAQNPKAGQSVGGQLAGYDADGNPLTYSIVTTPTQGVITLTNPATGDFIYTANPSAPGGLDAFSYRVSDGVYTSSNIITANIQVVSQVATRLEIQIQGANSGFYDRPLSWSSGASVDDVGGPYVRLYLTVKAAISNTTLTSATGLITITSGGQTLGTATIAGGIATYQITNTGLLPGAYNYSAVYGGDATVGASTANLLLTINKRLATVLIYTRTFTYDGAAKVFTATTEPRNSSVTGQPLSVTLTYNGSPTPPTLPGVYPVTGLISNTTYQGGATAALVINKIPAILTITNTTQTYDGTPRPVTITTAPGNYSVTVTYAGAATPPTNLGTYPVSATIVNTYYQGALSATLTINPAFVPVSLTVGAVNAAYTGREQCPTTVITPSNLPGVGVRFSTFVTPTWVAGCPINAGNHTLRAEVTNPDGALIAYVAVVTSTANIQPANLNILADQKFMALGGLDFSRFDQTASLPTDATAVGDLNGDARPDLVLASAANSVVLVQLGQGAGNFSAPVTYTLSNWFGDQPGLPGPRSLALADFNQDGKLDIAVSSLRSQGVFILFNKGAGTFAPATRVVQRHPVTGRFDTSAPAGSRGDDWRLSAPVGSAASSLLLLGNADYLAAQDINNDNRTDLAVVITNGVKGEVVVLLSLGNGGFQYAGAFGLEGSSAIASIAFGDFNKDGYADLVAAHPQANLVSVLLNRGYDETLPYFRPYYSRSPAAKDEYDQSCQTTKCGSPQWVATADFDKDGRVDVVVTNPYGYVNFLRGKGGGALETESLVYRDTFRYNLIELWENIGGLAVSDFDNNGYPDVAVARSGTFGGVTVLLNTGPKREVLTDSSISPFFPFAFFKTPISIDKTGAARGLTLADLNADGRADLTVAGNRTRTLMLLDNAMPALSWHAEGFVNGETASVLSGSPFLTTTATRYSPAGSYPILIYNQAGNVLSATNYNLLFWSNKLIIGASRSLSPTLPARGAAHLAVSAGTAIPYLYAANPDPVVYGTPLGADWLHATADISGTYSYSPTLGTVLPAGEHAVYITFAPTDTNFVSVTERIGVIIMQAPLTVTANDTAMQYGASVHPTLTLSYAGFVNGEGPNDLASQPNPETAAGPSSSVGPYVIHLTGGGSNNYALRLVTGTLNLTPAPLTVTAQSAARVYGSGNPPLAVSFSGFVNGDTGASLSAYPTAVTTAIADTPVGSYPITPRGGAAKNYSLIYVTAPLTITPAVVTVTATNTDWNPLDVPPPAFAARYTGFVNGESSASLSGAPLFQTSAQPFSAPGLYPITVTQGTLAATNYTFAFVNGVLSTTEVLIPQITWNPASLTYGAPLSVSQFNASSPVNGSFAYDLAPGLTLPAGEHALTATFTPLETGTYVTQTARARLAVGKAPLTIQVNDYAITYGDPLPALAIAYSGFVNGETANDLIHRPHVETTATTTSPAGTYALNLAGGASDNYAFNYIPGTLTINQAANQLQLTFPDEIPVGHNLRVTFNLSSSVKSLTPTGVVTLTVGESSCSAPLAQGYCTLFFLTPGNKSLVAAYSGDAGFAASALNSTLTVGQAQTVLTAQTNIADSLIRVNVVFSFTLQHTATGLVPSGVVTVTDGTERCVTTLAAGQCAFMFTSGGLKRITAVYSGDTNFAPSTADGFNLSVTAPPIYLPLIMRP